MCITETWLQDSTKDYCNFPNYNGFHICRTTRLHGGISIFVAGHIQATPIHELTFINDHIEINTLSVNILNNSFVICTIYRPDNKYERVEHFTAKLVDILNSTQLKKKRLVLIGDFNIDLLMHHNDIPTNNFLTTLQSLNFLPHISRPTRFPVGNQAGEPALLDHLYTNFHLKFKIGILSYDISDHLPIFINIPLTIANRNNN